jgi:hypothetical protein
MYTKHKYAYGTHHYHVLDCTSSCTGPRDPHWAEITNNTIAHLIPRHALATKALLSLTRSVLDWLVALASMRSDPISSAPPAASSASNIHILPHTNLLFRRRAYRSVECSAVTTPITSPALFRDRILLLLLIAGRRTISHFEISSIGPRIPFSRPKISPRKRVVASFLRRNGSLWPQIGVSADCLCLRTFNVVFHACSCDSL